MGDRSGIYRKKSLLSIKSHTKKEARSRVNGGKQGHWHRQRYGVRTKVPALGPGALEHLLGALWPLDGGEGLWGKCFRGLQGTCSSPDDPEQVDPVPGPP